MILQVLKKVRFLVGIEGSYGYAGVQHAAGAMENSKDKSGFPLEDARLAKGEAGEGEYGNENASLPK